MSHAFRRHVLLDAEYRAAMARDRAADERYRAALASSGGRFCDVGAAGALVPSRHRSTDLRSLTMTDQRAAKVLFAQLTECESSRGNRYLRGWAGASNLIGFRGDDDEQGRPTWKLYLAERTPKSGTVPDSMRARQERTSAAVARGVELDDQIQF
jgi:hypothetical protein